MVDKENKQSVQRLHWLAIDKRMLFCKLGHFTFYSALGCCLPYMTIFFVSVGLSRKEAGFIAGICFVFSTLSSSFWGFLADYTKRRKLIIIMLIIFSTLIIIAKPLVVWKVNTDYKSICSTNTSITNATKTNLEEECVRKPFQSTLFVVVLLMYILLQCFCIPIISQLDAFIMNIIKCNPGTSFGNQRVFGAIGFGITSFLAGIAADNFSVPSFSNYTPVFIMTCPIFLLLIPIVCVLSKQTNWDIENETENLAGDVEGGESNFKLVLLRLKEFKTVFFFTSVLIVGAVTSLFYSFNFLLMGDEMNASKTAMGLVTFVACFSETIMFPFSKRIIEYFGNPLICVEIGAFSFVLRLALISYIENAWLCVPVQVLHSLGFALTWAASVEYVGSISTSAISSAMFGILSSIYFGLGSLIGNTAGGVFYDMFGGRQLFRGVAVLNFGWVIVMFIYLHLIKCQCRETKADESAKNTDDLKDMEENNSLNDDVRLMKANC